MPAIPKQPETDHRCGGDVVPPPACDRRRLASTTSSTAAVRRRGRSIITFPAENPRSPAAAVEEAGRRVAETIAKLARETRCTGELLKAHAGLLAGWLRKSGFRDGCPITTVLLELAPRDRTVTQAGRDAYAARLGILTAKLVADGFAPARAARLAGLGFGDPGCPNPGAGGAKRRADRNGRGRVGENAG